MLVDNQHDNSDSKRLEWIHDLGIDASLNEWSRICSKTHTQTINNRLRLVQFNWLMQTNISPVRLNKFDSKTPDLCYKCNVHQGT